MWEQLWRKEESPHTLRPFVANAKVRCRGYSLGLERAVTDLGADESFAKASAKMKEHYGLELSTGKLRAVVEKHGEQMQRVPERPLRLGAGGVAALVAETDGSMVPCVVIAPGAGEGRKRREVCWKEAKLSLVRAPGSATARYAGTFQGARAAGLQWRQIAVQAGAGQATKMLGRGDGAVWIVRQGAEQFGEQWSYVLDFWHVSEYLGEVAGGDGKWLREQQERLRANESTSVMKELEELGRELGGACGAAARSSAEYLRERREYLDYAGALAQGYPIGSGEIESANRAVVQERLKISGAWWKVENAEKMLGLRTTRASGEWESYWSEQRQSRL